MFKAEPDESLWGFESHHELMVLFAPVLFLIWLHTDTVSAAKKPDQRSAEMITPRFVVFLSCSSVHVARLITDKPVPGKLTCENVN